VRRLLPKNPETLDKIADKTRIICSGAMRQFVTLSILILMSFMKNSNEI
jgi:hypothetical protein